MTANPYPQGLGSEEIILRRVPPNSLEAEQAVLGGIFVRGSILGDIATILRPADFYSRPHQIIFEAMLRLQQGQREIDLLTVADELQRMGHLDTVGAQPYLAELAGGVITAANAVSHAEIVQDHAHRRAAIEAGSRIIKAAYEAGDGSRVAEGFAREFLEQSAPLTSDPFKGFTLCELMATEFPEPRWAIDGLIPEGLTFIAGKPKLGKSWLALSMIIAVSSGGKALGLIDVDQGTALYLALEDTPRRMQSRCAMVLQDSRAPASAHVFTAWPRMGEGGISLLDGFLAEHSDTRLVVIDTWARFQPRRSGKAKGNPYLDDYADAGRVKELADKHGVAIVVIHHTRKADAEDSFDMVSGTTGLTGAADTTILLDRARNQADAILKVTGRDIDERELALQLHKESMTWQLLGDAEDYKRTTERQRIIQVMREFGEPMKPADIAMEMGIARDKTGSIRRLLGKMRDQGEVVQAEYGKYALLPTDEKKGNTGNSGNTSPGRPAITQPELLPSIKTPGNSGNGSEGVTASIATGNTSKPNHDEPLQATVTGVTAVTGRTEIPRNTADLAHWCREQKDNGVDLSIIVDKLAAAGVPAPWGRQWNRSQVYRLANEAAVHA